MGGGHAAILVIRKEAGVQETASDARCREVHGDRRYMDGGGTPGHRRMRSPPLSVIDWEYLGDEKGHVFVYLHLYRMTAAIS